MVAAAIGLSIRKIDVAVEGDLDLWGTLGIARDVPVGFETIRFCVEIEAPEATSEEVARLREKTQEYCVVLQTLMAPPRVEVEWAGA